MTPDNDDAARGWQASAAAWVATAQVRDRTLEPLTAALLGAARLSGARRALDVGCGTGTLLEAIAGRGVDVVGVDIAPGMVSAARRRVPGRRVEVADAQTADLVSVAPVPAYDRVVSRFGVMFFADPVAAFANLRAAAAPSARLAFSCWRTTEENPVFTLGTRVVTAATGGAAPVTGERGPTAFAEPDRTRRVLGEGGWCDVEIEPLDWTMRYGGDGADGVEERLPLALPDVAADRLRRELDDDAWQRLLKDVRTDIRTALVGDVVEIPAAAWVVSATA